MADIARLRLKIVKDTGVMRLDQARMSIGGRDIIIRRSSLTVPHSVLQLLVNVDCEEYGSSKRVCSAWAAV